MSYSCLVGHQSTGKLSFGFQESAMSVPVTRAPPSDEIRRTKSRNLQSGLVVAIAAATLRLRRLFLPWQAYGSIPGQPSSNATARLVLAAIGLGAVMVLLSGMLRNTKNRLGSVRGRSGPA
jgi:hypothetical protein